MESGFCHVVSLDMTCEGKEEEEKKKRRKEEELKKSCTPHQGRDWDEKCFMDI